MTELVPEAIEQYCCRHTVTESALLKGLVRTTRRETQCPGMQVGHVEGAFLRLLVQLTQARRILEIGTFTGYSALVMAEGLPPDGRLIACDIDPETTAIARRYWARSSHGGKIDLRIGNALDTLSSLKVAFDLVFIDADKENYTAYWNACVPKVRRGGLLVVDNVLWSGCVLRPKDATDRAIASFNRHVRRDRRVEAVMLPVRDGMLLARKK